MPPVQGGTMTTEVKIGIVVMLLLVTFAIVMSVMTNNFDTNHINKWAKDRNYQILSTKTTWFDNGPFWVRWDGQRIYRVELLDDREKPRVSYFRFGNWWYGPEQAWYQ